MRFLIRLFRAISWRVSYPLLLLLSEFISPGLRLEDWWVRVCFPFRYKAFFYWRMKHFLGSSLLIMTIFWDSKSINITIFYFKAFIILSIFPLISSRAYFLSRVSLFTNHILYLLIRNTSTLIFFIKPLKFISKNLLLYFIPFVISNWRTFLWGHLKPI